MFWRSENVRHKFSNDSQAKDKFHDKNFKISMCIRIFEWTNWYIYFSTIKHGLNSIGKKYDIIKNGITYISKLCCVDTQLAITSLRTTNRFRLCKSDIPTYVILTSSQSIGEKPPAPFIKKKSNIRHYLYTLFIILCFSILEMSAWFENIFL